MNLVIKSPNGLEISLKGTLDSKGVIKITSGQSYGFNYTRFNGVKFQLSQDISANEIKNTLSIIATPIQEITLEGRLSANNLKPSAIDLIGTKKLGDAAFFATLDIGEFGINQVGVGMEYKGLLGRFPYRVSGGVFYNLKSLPQNSSSSPIRDHLLPEGIFGFTPLLKIEIRW